jgi:hypothetical protein
MRSNRWGLRAALAALAAFVSLGDASAGPAATSPILLTGTLQFTSKITLASALPADQPITGIVSATAFDPKGTTSYQTLVSMTVTRKGNTASLSLSLPYHWSVSAKPTSISLTISAYAQMSVGQPNTSVTVTIPTPLNGKVTTLDLPLRL